MTNTKVSEKTLEKKLREEVKKLGGLALKFSSSTYTGMPDRIVLMPGGKTYWVELKSTGKKQTPIQTRVERKLYSLEHYVFLIDSLYTLSCFINIIR